MTSASAGWQSGVPHCSGPRGSRRALEIVGIVFGFFWFWPLAAAYIAWKVMGYPGLSDARSLVERGADNLRATPFRGPGFGGNPFAGAPFAGFSGSGNAAFDAYRRGEIERLERERRRLDDEAREFRSFVEDLKRAKDRDEFDAYMAKRRQDGPQSV